MVRDNDNIVNLMRLHPQESELIEVCAEVEIDNRMFQYLRQNIWLPTFFYLGNNHCIIAILDEIYRFIVRWSLFCLFIF